MANTRLFNLLFVSLIFSIPVNAASFDCNKATTQVEKIICDKSFLSLKDEVLNQEYNNLLSLANKSTQKQIKLLQRHWLLKRNSSYEGYGKESALNRAYEQQINRLTYMQKNIHNSLNINNPEIQIIFELLINEELPEPDSLESFGKDKYLLEITNTVHIEQGLYAANTKNKVIDKILGGWPSVIHHANEKEPVYLMKSISTSKGIMTTAIGAIFMDNSALGVNSVWIVSFETDAVSGECDRGPSINLQKISDLKRYSLDFVNDELVLTLDISEEDCTTKQRREYKKKFSFSNEGYKEII